jgi:hypothetical protein
VEGFYSSSLERYQQQQIQAPPRAGQQQIQARAANTYRQELEGQPIQEDPTRKARIVAPSDPRHPPLNEVRAKISILFNKLE